MGEQARGRDGRSAKGWREILLVCFGVLVLSAYVWTALVVLPGSERSKNFGYEYALASDGWRVTSVDPSGPAAGRLEPGDRIVSVDGDLRAARGLLRARYDRIEVGARYTLSIERDGALHDVWLEVGLRRNRAQALDVLLHFVVGLAFLLVGLTVSIARGSSRTARFMCATWITLALGLLSQSLLMLRHSLDPRARPLAWVGQHALVLAFCFGYAFASRVPEGIALTWFWRWLGRAVYAVAAVTIVLLVGIQAASLSGGTTEQVLGVPAATLFRLTSLLLLLVFIPGAGLAMCAVAVRNFRHAREPVQRRRTKWFIYGTLVGVTPFAVVQLLTELANTTGLPVAAPPVVTFLVTACILALPALVAYGIATERLFDVEVVVRRGLQHLLARSALLTAILSLEIVLAWVVLTNLDATLRQLVTANAGTIALLAVTAFALRFRRPIGDWIDRRFFHEARDREEVLRELATAVERMESLDEVVALVRGKIDATLHPRSVAIVFASAGEHLTPADIRERAGGASELLVPIPGAEGRTAGALALGPKRSEQLYSRTERRLLQDVATRVAGVFERVQLRERIEAEHRNSVEARKQQLEAEESERRARDESLAKSVFLASMSHELRTPLNAVLGFAQLIARDTDLKTEHRESLEIIQRSGEHLLGLIDDVLSISKIEAGTITLSTEPFDFDTLLRTVEDIITVRANVKGLVLECDRQPGLPSAVVGDEGKLRQVLINLLGNAVKFTDAGSVTLAVRWADGRAAFEISDTGHGIGESEIGDLFEAFSQTEAGRKSQEGTGLGLVISQHIVTLMGGRIEVESALGRGSTFRFEVHLPAVAAPVRPREQRRVVSIAGAEHRHRLLVVDDVAENRMLLVRLLQSVGFDVREATNGAEAVDLWAEWGPSLIWMDMRMPVMNGLEATREIRSRQESGEGGPCRIVALTASAFEHERDAILEGGVDDFVTKPFRAAAIFEKLTEHLGVRFVYLDEPSCSPSERQRPGGDRLSEQPAEVLAALERALSIGDFEAARGLVAGIGLGDEALARDLAASLKGYRLDDLLARIERAKATPEG